MVLKRTARLKTSGVSDIFLQKKKRQTFFARKISGISRGPNGRGTPAEDYTAATTESMSPQFTGYEKSEAHCNLAQFAPSCSQAQCLAAFVCQGIRDPVHDKSSQALGLTA